MRFWILTAALAAVAAAPMVAFSARLAGAMVGAS